MVAKRTILYCNVDPEDRERYKAAAARSGKTLGEWAIEAMREKLERDMTPGEKLRQFLRIMEEAQPKIAAGTKGKTDAVEAIRASREERQKAIGG